MAWDTVANIITDVAVELGLETEAISDPYAETDQNIVLLRHLLKSLGQTLLRDYSWTHLQEEHTFDTANGTPNYDLPAGLARIVNGTAWNRTQELPLVGPVNAQQWQTLKAGSSTGTVTKVFRIWQDDFWLHPTPTAAESVYYEYVSKYWVATTGASAPSKEAPTVNSDELWFDRQLLVTGLKYQFRRAKRMATQDDLDEFLRALSLAQGADGASPTFVLGGTQLGAARLLDDANIPETGFGD